ncbi:MAG: hypothetical protein CVU38_11155 [Chloroflexi bacterium HGW-Chloroflexi-1]|nr:MAG: hypothetical protein CVU38_11155 [Chloroflexi bacterium HGW-Chloroflexi-1]
MSSLKGELLDLLIAPEVPADDLRRRVLEVLQAPAPSPRMTYEEFLTWADEDTHAEWVDGEVVMYSPAGDQHQDICGFLGAILRAFVETHQLGVVRVAPFQMRLARSGREPDVVFLAREHLQRLKKTCLDGPADLVVEILSPESAMRDRGQKFYEYEEAGIPEYWLIDPDRARVEFYQLDTQGRYAAVAPDAEGIYRSQALPDFWLDVDWLWQPPSLIATQQTLGLI